MRNDGGFLLWWDGLRSEMQPIHDSQGVFAVLEKEVRRLGFDYYAYGVRHTIPFTRPKTEVHGTYPKAWLERYQMQNYGAVDPAILNGLRSSEMVVWSDSLFDQSRMLWNEARDWGLCVGATLPIRAPNNLLSVLSVARDQQNISSFEREEIRLRLRCMIELLTQKLTDLEHPMLMSNPVCLSHREREILQWTADGKSSGEIAIILSISESTVNFHHKNIQKKFDAPNKTLAAAYAASAADDPQLAMKIFWSSLQCAWYLGASSVVAVTTTAMERYFVRNGVILQRLGPPQKVKGETLVAISFPAYQERGLEMLLRYHPEWLQGVPLSMAV
ncbi:transcriptional regulator SdiA [Pseudomonas aeruginosa]|nr:transcriptional regulator SdiA [Pseudomonas aeruginosa]